MLETMSRRVQGCPMGIILLQTAEGGPSAHHSHKLSLIIRPHHLRATLGLLQLKIDRRLVVLLCEGHHEMVRRMCHRVLLLQVLLHLPVRLLMPLGFILIVSRRSKEVVYPGNLVFILIV